MAWVGVEVSGGGVFAGLEKVGACIHRLDTLLPTFPIVPPIHTGHMEYPMDGWDTGKVKMKGGK